MASSLESRPSLSAMPAKSASAMALEAFWVSASAKLSRCPNSVPGGMVKARPTTGAGMVRFIWAIPFVASPMYPPVASSTTGKKAA